MSRFKSFLKTLWKDESGQSATEYILILAVLVAIVLVVGKTMKGKMGDVVKKALEKVTGGMDKLDAVSGDGG